MKFAQALSTTLLLSGLSPSQSVGVYPKPTSIAIDDSASVLASVVSETACVTTLEYSYDSGLTDSASTTVTTDNEDAEYLQLDLNGTVLGDDALLTLEAGRTIQTLTAKSLADDSFFSAQFGALSISVTLSTVRGKADKKRWTRGGRNERDGSSMVKINGLKLGGVCGDGAVASICGTDDDREVSNDPRQGRIGGCTGWLISKDVFIQAGHCGTPSASTRIHFTPTSGSADPEDQYAVDVATYTGVNGGVGNDWGVGRLLPNSETGELAGDSQGSWYLLGNVPTTTANNNIRITGYGTAATLSRYQKTHTGALVGIASTSLSYVPDTTGGNSGSPVVHEETGDAIGVHTHGGCSANGGSNKGTRIDKPEFAAAINFLLSGQTPPPSPAPTNSPPCAAGLSNIQVEILTDDYPSETTWSLTDTSTNQVVMDSDVYQSSGTLYTKETGCRADTQYRFLISDSYGDGICCSYGSGSYEVKSDGVQKAQGGAFTSSETTTFNSGDITPTTPPPTPAPTPSPTPAPTPSPTPAPTTSSPTFFTCRMFNEIECPTAHEGQCQWLGSCHNCGCVPRPRS